MNSRSSARSGLLRGIIPVLLPALTLSSSVFGWAQPTHLMIGHEIAMQDALPQEVYSREFVISNNSPDIFAINGPEFAHGDYRFAAILLELAGTNAQQRAYAFGWTAHIAADLVVHSRFPSSSWVSDAIEELGMACSLYRLKPEFQEPANEVVFGYYPDLLVEASELYVERYQSGSVFEREVLDRSARILALAMLAEKFIINSPLLSTWAQRFEPDSGVEETYDDAVALALQQVRALGAGELSFVEASRTTVSPSQGAAVICFARLGEMLQSRGLAALSRSRSGDLVTFSGTLLCDEQSLDDSLAVSLFRDSGLPWQPSPAGDSSTGLETKDWTSGLNLSIYPNPFNNACRIDLASDVFVDNVRVRVLNLSGQQVRLLYQGGLSPGVKTLTWNGINGRGGHAASGVYFVQISAEGGSLSSKILLLK